MIDHRARKPILRVRRQQAGAYRPGACGALHSPASLINLASYHPWVCVAGSAKFPAILWSKEPQLRIGSCAVKGCLIDEYAFQKKTPHSSGFEGRPGAHMKPSRVTWNKGKFEQTRRRRSANSRKCARDSEGARGRVRPNLNPTSLAPNEAGSVVPHPERLGRGFPLVSGVAMRFY